MSSRRAAGAGRRAATETLRVDDVVGDLHAQAADDGGVDDRVERRRPRRSACARAAVRRSDCAALSGDGRDDRGDHAAALVGDEVHGAATSSWRTRRSRGCWTSDETMSDRRGARAAVEQRLDERALGGGVAEAAAERELELGVRRRRCARTREQLALDVGAAVGDRAAARTASSSIAVDEVGRESTSAARRPSSAATTVVGAEAPPKTSATTLARARRRDADGVGERAAQLRRVADGPRRGEQLAGGRRGRRPTAASSAAVVAASA